MTEEKKKEIYDKWNKLVNMSYSELENFYNSDLGKKSGLKPSQAKNAGAGGGAISTGRQSARWIMKMLKTPKEDWSLGMWKWANKQISFISRMKGNKGPLYDDKRNPTRKLLSLKIWGHNPEKKS